MVNKSTTSTIGERLLQIRREHKMSLRELEAKSGTSASLLSQIENGKANPSVMTLQNIATALGVAVKYFFDADEPIATPANQEKITSDSNDNGHNLSAKRPLAVPNTSSQGLCDTIVHPDTRITIELEGGVTWERLTAGKEDGIEFLEVIYDVGTSSGPDLAGHQGQECALVLEGELLLEIGDEQYTLQAGDSMTFDSMIPHRVTNIGQTPLKVFWGNLNSQSQPIG